VFHYSILLTTHSSLFVFCLRTTARTSLLY
jgi:hypothetical protein